MSEDGIQVMLTLGVRWASYSLTQVSSRDFFLFVEGTHFHWISLKIHLRAFWRGMKAVAKKAEVDSQKMLINTFDCK